MAFADNLKKLRKARGLTQQELADLVGIGKSTIAGYEVGNREPDVEKIKRISKALNVTGDELLGIVPNNETAPGLSAEAVTIAKKYDALDPWGKNVVRDVVNGETVRMKAAEEETRRMMPETKIIPLFGASFAAGIGEPDFGNSFEDYEVPADSKGEFAVRVNGDSMEPYFPDGSIALGVKRTPKDGDVAALMVDGEFYIKQICIDVYGNLYLFSLNRERKAMDKTVWASAGSTVMCFGTILMEKRVPLPLD